MLAASHLHHISSMKLQAYDIARFESCSDICSQNEANKFERSIGWRGLSSIAGVQLGQIKCLHVEAI